MDTTIGEVVAAAVEKAMSKVLSALFENLSETIGQVMTDHMTQILKVAGRTALRTGVMPNHEELTEDPVIEAVSGASDDNETTTSRFEQEGGSISETTSESLESMDLDIRATKRRAAPYSPKSVLLHRLKTKKCQDHSPSKKEDFLKDSILQKAVETAGLQST